MQPLILDATDKSITIKLGAAKTTNELIFTAHYADATDTALTEGSCDGVTNGTTAVELVPDPAASTRRVVKCITIYNADTVAATVTLALLHGADSRTLRVKELAAGETWIPMEEAVAGSSSGGGGGVGGVQQVRRTTQQADNTGNWVDVTSMAITYTCTGTNVRVTYKAATSYISAIGTFRLLMDSTVLETLTTSPVSGMIFDYLSTPSAASHTFKVQMKALGGGYVLDNPNGMLDSVLTLIDYGI